MWARQSVFSSVFVHDNVDGFAVWDGRSIRHTHLVAPESPQQYAYDRVSKPSQTKLSKAVKSCHGRQSKAEPISHASTARKEHDRRHICCHWACASAHLRESANECASRRASMRACMRALRFQHCCAYVYVVYVNSHAHWSIAPIETWSLNSLSGFWKLSWIQTGSIITSPVFVTFFCFWMEPWTFFAHLQF